MDINVHDVFMIHFVILLVENTCMQIIDIGPKKLFFVLGHFGANVHFQNKATFSEPKKCFKIMLSV